MRTALTHCDLLPYPIDISLLLAQLPDTLDASGALYSTTSSEISAKHPTAIAQCALAHWNVYLKNGSDRHKDAFIAQARWLLAHEFHLSSDASGWLVRVRATFPQTVGAGVDGWMGGDPCGRPFHPSKKTGEVCDGERPQGSSAPTDEKLSNNLTATQPCLSALAQGNAISVLVRAYQLTQEEAFLQAARRAVRTFELDILDTGVSTPIGANGIFFEEVAIYPAAHVLKGHILALFGLYDYVALTHNSTIEMLIQRSITALHILLDAFDTGYWTYSDLLHKRLASRSCHTLHVTLLEALARYSGCQHCRALAARWARYQARPECRLRYLITNHICTYWDKKLKPRLRRCIFRSVDINNQASSGRVCIPITAFPVPGGMRGVLKGVAQVMDNQWQMTYLTHHKGQDTGELEIEVFGRRIASPWNFPGVWLYCLSGWSKLCKLLRNSDFSLILPQDGIFTAAFAVMVGKIAGIRVVCMDHGSITLLDNPSFRKECIGYLKTYPWYRRIFLSLGFNFYWPSQHVLAWIAAHGADQFLIAGDEVEEAYHNLLGVHPSRILRYAYMIDAARFTPLDKATRANTHAEQGLSEDAIVITLINRLAPEKGLDFALEGIASALKVLPLDIQARVKVLIVGDGPLRSQVEADIQRYNLNSVCVLWGVANPSDVVSLLGISDIFLYSGTRGTNYSMAVLEAMAAGCAVIASVMPQSNAQLLAEGRGIAITPASATDISAALVRLCGDLTLCHNMGYMAREYVTTYHSAQMLKRSLLRASFFVPPIHSPTNRLHLR